MLKFIVLLFCSMTMIFAQDSGKSEFLNDLKQLQKLDSTNSIGIIMGSKSVDNNALDEKWNNLKDSSLTVYKNGYISNRKIYVVNKEKVYQVRAIFDMDVNKHELIYMYEVLVLSFTENYSGDIDLLNETIPGLIFSVSSTLGYSDKTTFSTPWDFNNAKLSSMEYIKKKSVKDVYRVLGD